MELYFNFPHTPTCIRASLQGQRPCCNILHIRLQGTRFGVRVQCVYTDNTRKFTKLFQNTLYYNVQVVKFNRESKIHLLTFHKLYPVNVRLRGTRFCVRVQCVYTDNTRRFTKPFQNTLYYNAQDRKIQPWIENTFTDFP